MLGLGCSLDTTRKDGGTLVDGWKTGAWVWYARLLPKGIGLPLPGKSGPACPVGCESREAEERLVDTHCEPRLHARSSAGRSVGRAISACAGRRESLHLQLCAGKLAATGRIFPSSRKVEGVAFAEGEVSSGCALGERASGGVAGWRGEASCERGVSRSSALACREVASAER